MSGWDFATITTTSQDSVAHYYFNLTATNENYSLTATLAWNRGLNATSINDLDLYLYRVSDAAQVALSTSRVDNIEHIYMQSLPAGRYDLQVLKNSGTRSITASETYALAYESFVMPLNISKQSGNFVVSWPLYPNGFTLESAPGFSLPITWTPVTSGVILSNNSYRLAVTSPTGIKFYRLTR
ncbi:MAG: hypothetical protein ACXWIU_09065 [Limisphaerales bacterium]